MEDILEKQRRISKPLKVTFSVSQPGLVAIFITARCSSKSQSQSGQEENLRFEINGLRFRELPPHSNEQVFDIPAACNGAKLQGLAQTVILFTSLQKGTHTLGLVPRSSAYIELIRTQELSGNERVRLDIEEQAEDGDRRPWYSFIFIDLPLRMFVVDATIEKRVRDSDDVQFVVDGRVIQSAVAGKFRLWQFVGSLLAWLVRGVRGQRRRSSVNFESRLETGVHYVELYADRMPTLHRVEFLLEYSETNAEKRAARLLEVYASIVKAAAKEFDTDPVMVGAVIYQEQSTNVNFVDTLTDTIGGVIGLNTSVGIGQVRVNTARALEEKYPQLVSLSTVFSESGDFARVERLKDPFLNIRYVAAKVHFDETHWKGAGFDLSGRHDILGTLYNTQDVEHPLTSHANPEANEFGIGVGENYERVRALLGA
ncbi:MAG: hypothetical protein AAB798_01190 [Patescibacteria group bacterium]